MIATPSTRTPHTPRFDAVLRKMERWHQGSIAGDFHQFRDTNRFGTALLGAVRLVRQHEFIDCAPVCDPNATPGIFVSLNATGPHLSLCQEFAKARAADPGVFDSGRQSEPARLQRNRTIVNIRLDFRGHQHAANYSIWRFLAISTLGRNVRADVRDAPVARRS